MKILLIGDVAGKNYYHVGDEAIMTARVDWLRKNFPKAELTIYSSDPEFTKQIHKCQSISEPALLKKNRFLYKLPWKLISFIVEKIKFLPTISDFSKLRQMSSIVESNLLWICGGGNINSSYSKLIFMRTTIATICISRQIPIIITGQTLGPTLTQEDSKLLSTWLPKVKYLGARDRKNSPNIAKMLTVNSDKIDVTLDDAFWLDASAPQECSLTQKIKASEQPVIGVSFYYTWNQPLNKRVYIDRLSKLVDFLIENINCTVLSIPHVYSKRGGSDVEFAKNIREQVKEKSKFLMIEKFFTDREIKWITGRCDYVFSNRYHGLIFALSQGIPCTGIYQEKYTQTKLNGAYELLNIDSNTFSIHEISSFDIIREHWHSRRKLKQILDTQLNVFRDAQMATDDKLRDLVQSFHSF